MSARWMFLGCTASSSPKTSVFAIPMFLGREISNRWRLAAFPQDEERQASPPHMRSSARNSQDAECPYLGCETANSPLRSSTATTLLRTDDANKAPTASCLLD